MGRWGSTGAGRTTHLPRWQSLRGRVRCTHAAPSSQDQGACSGHADTLSRMGWERQTHTCAQLAGGREIGHGRKGTSAISLSSFFSVLLSLRSPLSASGPPWRTATPCRRTLLPTSRHTTHRRWKAPSSKRREKRTVICCHDRRDGGTRLTACPPTILPALLLLFCEPYRRSLGAWGRGGQACPAAPCASSSGPRLGSVTPMLSVQPVLSDSRVHPRHTPPPAVSETTKM